MCIAITGLTFFLCSLSRAMPKQLLPRLTEEKVDEKVMGDSCMSHLSLQN